MGCNACCTTKEKDEQVQTILNDNENFTAQPMSEARKMSKEDDATEELDNKTILITDLPSGCKYSGDTKFYGGKMV
jgi:hypothetical protein